MGQCDIIAVMTVITIFVSEWEWDQIRTIKIFLGHMTSKLVVRTALADSCSILRFVRSHDYERCPLGILVQIQLKVLCAFPITSRNL